MLGLTNSQLFSVVTSPKTEGTSTGAHDEECHNKRQDNVSPEQHGVNMENPGNHVESTVLEDWRGQGNPKKRQRRIKSYLNANLEWVYTDLTAERKPVSLGLLKNGHRLELKPVKISGESYILANTCAFDAFVQLICLAYCDSAAFKSVVDEREETVFSLIRHVTTSGVGTAVYKQRAQIMKDVFDIERLPANVNRIHGECCIASLVKAIWLLPVISEVSICSSANSPNEGRENEMQILTVHQSAEDEITVLEQRMQRSLEDRNTMFG
jgi:hypothetical protein